MSTMTPMSLTMMPASGMSLLVLKRKWSDRGPTTIYAQYYSSSDSSDSSVQQLPTKLTIDSSYWGFGIAQDFTAANMYLYAGYRQYEHRQRRLSVVWDLKMLTPLSSVASSTSSHLTHQI